MIRCPTPIIAVVFAVINYMEIQLDDLELNNGK
jgi:hypothetical protein